WARAGGGAVGGGVRGCLMQKRDLSVGGAPPAAVMIELPPMDVSPPAETSPDVAEGPEMRQAESEEVETPQVITPQEIPPAKKPDAVLVTTPKPKPKPKKIVKEKPVVKRTHEPPATRATRAWPDIRSAAPGLGRVRRVHLFLAHPNLRAFTRLRARRRGGNRSRLSFLHPDAQWTSHCIRPCRKLRV